MPERVERARKEIRPNLNKSYPEKSKEEKDKIAWGTAWKQEKAKAKKKKVKEEAKLLPGEETVYNPETYNKDDPDYINNEAGGEEAGEEEQLRGLGEAYEGYDFGGDDLEDNFLWLDKDDMSVTPSSPEEELDRILGAVGDGTMTSEEANNALEGEGTEEDFIEPTMDDAFGLNVPEEEPVPESELPLIGRENDLPDSVNQPSTENNYGLPELDPNYVNNMYEATKGYGDIWEWRGRSTIDKAVAWAIVKESDVYQFSFSLIRNTSALWNSDWAPLKNTGAKAIVKLDVSKKGLDATKPYDDTIAYSDIPNLLVVAKDVLRDYFSKFSVKSLFNYFTMTCAKTDRNQLQFINEFIKNIGNGLSRVEDIENELCKESVVLRNLKVFVFKNSSGPKLKERVGDSFTGINTPGSLGPAWDGVINSEEHSTVVAGGALEIQKASRWGKAPCMGIKVTTAIMGEDVSYAARVQEFLNEDVRLRDAIKEVANIYSVPFDLVLEDCQLVGMTEEESGGAPSATMATGTSIGELTPEHSRTVIMPDNPTGENPFEN